MNFKMKQQKQNLNNLWKTYNSFFLKLTFNTIIAIITKTSVGFENVELTQKRKIHKNQSSCQHYLVHCFQMIWEK